MKKTTAEKPSSKKKATKPAARPAKKVAKKASKPASEAATRDVKPAAKKAPRPAAVEQAPQGAGTRDEPWELSTPGEGSKFEAFCDEGHDPPALIVREGKTELRYDLRCLDDLHAMVRSRGGWVILGSADEREPAAEGTVEAWARSTKNPLGGFYGLKRGLRGRFASYVPPVLARLGRAEIEAAKGGLRMRAI